MPDDRKAEFGFGLEGLLERYCPVCGELRPVRVHHESDGTKQCFCAKCQAPLGEEVAGGFSDAQESGESSGSN